MVSKKAGRPLPVADPDVDNRIHVSQGARLNNQKILVYEDSLRWCTRTVRQSLGFRLARPKSAWHWSATTALKFTARARTADDVLSRDVVLGEAMSSWQRWSKNVLALKFLGLSAIYPHAHTATRSRLKVSLWVRGSFGALPARYKNDPIIPDYCQ